MQNTNNLNLPYIMSAQAQKHVTHNEALRMLDSLVQLSVKSRSLASESAPEEGARYIVPANPDANWIGQEGNIAAWQDGSWWFFEPLPGWVAWVEEDGENVVFTNGDWEPSALDTTPLFGINTQAGETNRLAVKSDVALFSHDDVTPGSGDMRLTINKAAPNGTASALFQTNYSGRAEFGMLGNDKFGLKVSGDGSIWNTPLTIDNQSGHLGVATQSPAKPLHVAGPARLEEVHSGELSLTNNTLQNIECNEITGFFYIWAYGTIYPQPFAYGQFWYDAGLSLSVDTISKGSKLDITTDVLTLNDATPGQLTVSIDKGQITICNRLGGARVFRYLFIA